MKLVSWNVNGLRAVHRKGEWEQIFKMDPDIVFLQETKAKEEQLSDEIKNIPYYNSYFVSPTEKNGYSGVGLYTKEIPQEVRYGLGVKHLDTEGRQITAIFKDFVAIGTYFPNGGGGPERLEYKLDYYDAFLEYVENLRKEHKNIIFCGDVNTAHEAIDLARPKENEENTGFLPEERAWLDEVVRHGYIDTFRSQNPTKTGAYSYWDMKTRARERNVGWRIDYIFISQELQKTLKNATIHNDMYGSDHCPISVELSI